MTATDPSGHPASEAAPAPADQLRQRVEQHAAALVTGPAGAGRTHLLGAFAADEAGNGREVWWCRGHQVGPASGNGLFASPDLTEHTVAELAPALTEGEVTIVVDDAHLLVPTTLQCLTWATERRHDLGCRIVVARRPVRAERHLAALDTCLVGTHGAVHLGPLTAAEISAQLPDDTGTRPSVDELLHLTHGWAELVVARLRGPRALHDLVASRIGLTPTEHLPALWAMAFGVPVGSAAHGPYTGLDGPASDRVIDHALETGLLHDRTGPVPAAAAALRADTPESHRARLAEVVLDRGEPAVVTEVAHHLLEMGHRSAPAARLHATVAELLDTEPTRALAHHEAAIACGADPAASRNAHAWAAVAAHRPDVALRLAHHDRPDPTATTTDDGTGAEPEPDPSMHHVTGAAWAHHGRPHLAADAYRRALLPALAAVTLFASGRVAEAHAQLALLDELPAGPADGSHELALGVRAWLEGDRNQAIAQLESAAAMAATHQEAGRWPDTPHAVLTALLLQLPDPAATERATRTVAAALADGPDGPGGPTFEPRHRLLGAWAALRSGQTDEAAAPLDDAATSGVRNAMVAAGIRAALAVRSDDPNAIVAARRDTAAAWQGGEADAFTLQLAGEMALLASRAGHDAEPVLQPVEALVAALGGSATVAAPLAWARLLIGSTSDDAAATRAAAEQLGRLAAGAPDDEPTRALTAAAAVFADVMEGTIHTDAVVDAAERLVERGLVFEATRLLGAAGLRGSDPDATKALLARLRQLQVSKVRPGRGSTKLVAELSNREREVAEALLHGHTHKEIGAQLYISAKTVEHHVARIRQKLGATNRADLLASIKESLAG